MELDAVRDSDLQQELQRFTTRFTDRIAQAAEILETRSPREQGDELLRRSLLYISSAMEIATGPVSEINLADMIVFVRLCRGVLEDDAIAELSGDQRALFVDVFDTSDRELSAMAEHAMTPSQRDQLATLVETWRVANPSQTRVEGIRLADFSLAPGASSEGLLSSVKSARRAANQAVMLSERVMFLVNRMPYLWRLQARLGAREMLGDALGLLFESDDSPVARLSRGTRQLARRVATYGAALASAGLLAWSIASLVERRKRHRRFALPMPHFSA